MHPTESAPQTSFNAHVSLLFFHFVIEISEEVADQVIKGARQFNGDRHVRDARVRDAVRERDAARINEAVLTIVADYAERLQALRKAATATAREASEILEVVDWGIRTFGSYAGVIRTRHLSVNCPLSNLLGIRLGRHQSHRDADDDPTPFYSLVRSITIRPHGRSWSTPSYRLKGSQGTHG
jgi:hypothetical protein